MATVEELTAQLEKLRAVRAKGVSEAESDGERVRFRSDAELAAAIADLERQIASTTARSPVVRVTILNDKGFF